MTTGKGKCMKVHSLLKSLNAIDEEMIAEADRFAVKRKGAIEKQTAYFVTEVTAVAAIAIAVAGVFFLLVAARSHTTKAVRSKWSSAG